MYIEVTGGTHAVSHAMTDDQGLVCAFRLSPFVRLGDEALKDDPAGQPIWLHFNLNDARARRWLQQRAQLPAEARDLLLSSDQRIQVEFLPSGLVAVLGDLDHDFHGDASEFHTLRLYLDSDRLITARSHPLKSADLLRRRLQSGSVTVKSPIALLERFIESLAQTLAGAVTRLGNEVDDAEEQILGGRFQDQGKGLGKIRRSLAQLRRHLHANRTALSPVPGRLAAAYGAEQTQDLRQAVESLEAVGQDLELVQERARLLQEEMAGRLGEATNRNLFVLSMVTTTLLPITLITGIFGMNVGGLPWVGRSSGFWWVILLMTIALAITLMLLRRRRIL